MKPSKQGARVDTEDDATSETHARVPSVAVNAPSAARALLDPPTALAAAAASSTPSSLISSKVMLPRAGPDGDSEAAPSSTAAAASSLSASSAVLDPPAASSPFGRLADIEAQLIVQHLDQRSLLHLARCSCALFRCASHPFVWQQLRFPVHVRGSEVSEDPRRAGSLLRFAPSSANVREHESDPSSLVSCATLLRVHQLVSLEFEHSPQPFMLLEDWRTFLQHSNAQRLRDVDINRQPGLCDATSVSLLGQLPYLSSLRLHLPAAATASFLAPLVNCPTLTDVSLCRPMDGSASLPAPLEPLAQCTRLRQLGLEGVTLRVGQLSALLMQLAQAGGRLHSLRLAYLRVIPMHGSIVPAAVEPAGDTLGLELILASPYLPHLHTLMLSGGAISTDCVTCYPHLRLLVLTHTFFPSAMKLELLFHVLPLGCILIPFRPVHAVQHPVKQQNEAMLPQLLLLAQKCPRLVIKEIE